jgi:cytochrome b561
MSLRNTTASYGSLARFFHWTMFLLILGTIIVGLTMEDLPEEQHEVAEMIHRSIGVVILALLVLRFGWRLINVSPADPPGPAWMNATARAVHWLFYPLILLQTVAGIVLSQAGGEAVTLFGLVSLPVMVAPDEQVEHFWEEVHEVNWIILAVLVAGHSLVALHHHFGAKDDVLRRMWSGVR